MPKTLRFTSHLPAIPDYVVTLMQDGEIYGVFAASPLSVMSGAEYVYSAVLPDDIPVGDYYARIVRFGEPDSWGDPWPVKVDSTDGPYLVGGATLDQEILNQFDRLQTAGIAVSSINNTAKQQLAGTVISFRVPVWTGNGFDRPIVCGTSYQGDLRPEIIIEGWDGPDLQNCESITFSGVMRLECAVHDFSVTIDPLTVNHDSDDYVIPIAMTAGQTLEIVPGKYKCDLIAVWADGESQSLFPKGFVQEFRAING